VLLIVRVAETVINICEVIWSSKFGIYVLRRALKATGKFRLVKVQKERKMKRLEFAPVFVNILIVSTITD
jgi:hypothetical protein